jgi:hypothetical protein
VDKSLQRDITKSFKKYIIYFINQIHIDKYLSKSNQFSGKLYYLPKCSTIEIKKIENIITKSEIPFIPTNDNISNNSKNN